MERISEERFQRGGADGVRLSEVGSLTTMEPSRGAEFPSHLFLERGGFIDTGLGRGLNTLLPLGKRVEKKIQEVIEKEMALIGAQQVKIPTLQPVDIWAVSGRLDTFRPPLFRTGGGRYCLAPTHEEAMADLVSRMLGRGSRLPLALWQIGEKFRDEHRPRGAQLRGIVFSMFDLYSFHNSERDLKEYYEKVLKVYSNIFKKVGLEPVTIQADSGSMGGSVSHEFMVITEVGDDKISCCSTCGFFPNPETLEGNLVACPNCGVREGKGFEVGIRGVEVGHIFQLGTKYTEAFRLRGPDGSYLHEGCYGIGVGRLMATVVEEHHDRDGIIWPDRIAPYDLHLISISRSGGEPEKIAEELFVRLKGAGIEVLYDDRDRGAGVKLADADLIGCPVRVVVSERSLSQGGVAFKKRQEERERERIFSPEKLLQKLGGR